MINSNHPTELLWKLNELVKYIKHSVNINDDYYVDSKEMNLVKYFQEWANRNSEYFW